MAVPTGSAYVEALQLPAAALFDEELAEGEVDTNALGLPRPVSGNVASVFRIRTPHGRRFAVRCFLRDFDDQAERYEVISEHLAGIEDPWLVRFEFQPEGIFVGGEAYPIVKMAWADGVPLDVFVEQNLWDGPLLATVARNFADVLQSLEDAEVAHGDLQHGNILVTATGGLRLIDYDGMWVPALSGWPSNELGHRNYRHPTRTLDDFGPALDHFAGWVIYLSLVLLAVDPLLWARLDGGDERLLFREEDFVNPAGSAAFALLERHDDEDIRYYGAVLRQLCSVPTNQLPALSLRDAPQLAPPATVRRRESTAADAKLLDAIRSADVIEPIEVEEPEAVGFLDRVRGKKAPAAPQDLPELRQAVADADTRLTLVQKQRDALDAADEELRAKASHADLEVLKREKAELTAVADELVQAKAVMAQQERDLTIGEREERNAALAKLIETSKNEARTRMRLMGAPGVPEAVAFALSRIGVRISTDFVEAKSDSRRAKKHQPGLVITPDGKTHEISSIGPAEAEMLMTWKKRVESIADKTGPDTLPNDIEDEIRVKFNRARQEILKREPKARAEAADKQDAVILRSEDDRARIAQQLQDRQQELSEERIRVDKLLLQAKKDAAEARFRLDEADSGAQV